MKRKAAFIPLLAAVVLLIVSGFSSPSINKLIGAENQSEALKTYNKVYAETPFVRDPDREITMHSSSIEESDALYKKVYAETPFIKQATAGRGLDVPSLGIQAAPLPYYFNFTFDSTLTSSTISNNQDTVRITANADWDQSPNDYEGSAYDYYDVTLYADGVSQGTVRFDIGAWQHGDWTDVPDTDNMYFVMTKHVLTWTGSPYPSYNGDISGSGEVLNP